jgi:hypothetical protein
MSLILPLQAVRFYTPAYYTSPICFCRSGPAGKLWHFPTGSAINVSRLARYMADPGRRFHSIGEIFSLEPEGHVHKADQNGYFQ